MALTYNHCFTYYESEFGGSDHDQSSQSQLYGDDHSPTKNFSMSNSSSLSSPSSSNSSGLGYQQTLKYHQSSEENNSVINFKAGSLLSFDQNEHFHQSLYSRMSNQEDFSIWEDNIHHGYQNHHHQLNSKCSNPNLLMLENPNKMQTARRSLQFGIEDLAKDEAPLNKRPYVEESTQPNKKQCTSPTKQITPKSSPAKDPQSIAAKNRREKISERLKLLQELVPNGSKVDMVTMLEKAIGYVKFLQLQVKVLATNEFWPAQGGKAPNLSQVKETIDAILASRRERN